MWTIRLFLFCYYIAAVFCIKGDSVQKLTKIKWRLHNANKSITIPANVPGGVYSDLQDAGYIGDILYRFNDVLTRWVAHDNWTYVGKFDISNQQLMENRSANLVLYGVDTVSFVEFNDVPIGTTNNMFVRYVFDVKKHLEEGENTIKIAISSPIAAARRMSEKHFTAPDCVPPIYNGECHINQLRKMQASFGWDWGPAIPSSGLWKPVVIEFYDRALLRSVTTHIKKVDKHWHLRVKYYLETNKDLKSWSGRISAALTVDKSQKMTLVDYRELKVTNGLATTELNMTISENVVQTWWPNEYGEQPLYDLQVSISNAEELHVKKLRIGFRTIELVQTEFDGKLVGSSGYTFYFRVNGYPIFMKGSNWIPAHILPEYGSDRKTDNYIQGKVLKTSSRGMILLINMNNNFYWTNFKIAKKFNRSILKVLELLDGNVLYVRKMDQLLTSARDAHMNMLRVWGGGVYESEYFYERCDELGILIWQDFLFACSMYPINNEFISSVSKEIRQTVKRLQHHPSIAVWAGNNENEAALSGDWYGTSGQFERYRAEYIALYVYVIAKIVRRLDDRPYLYSSPSNGRFTIMEGYVSDNPYNPRYGDTHYYNYIADSWNIDIYPETRFASEYGFQSLPSIATMEKATNMTQDFSIESTYSKHRQHSVGGYGNIIRQIKRHMKLEKQNVSELYNEIPDKQNVGIVGLTDPRRVPQNQTVDYEYFKKVVFYSQISQAMAIKTETEFYRQSRADWFTMGALYWQLNDVWVAPSWSSIEYGNKWKMLHYFAVNFFAPVLVSPRLTNYLDLHVYLINDNFVPIENATILVDYFKWDSLIPVASHNYSARVGALSAEKQNIIIHLWEKQYAEEMFLKFTLIADGVTSPTNYVFPGPFVSAKGMKKPNISLSVVKDEDSSSGDHKYLIDIRTDSVVLFFWMETYIEGGYFEENGLIITEPNITVNYFSPRDFSAETFEKSISYQYYTNS